MVIIIRWKYTYGHNKPIFSQKSHKIILHWFLLRNAFQVYKCLCWGYLTYLIKSKLKIFWVSLYYWIFSLLFDCFMFNIINQNKRVRTKDPIDKRSKRSKFDKRSKRVKCDKWSNKSKFDKRSKRVKCDKWSNKSKFDKRSNLQKMVFEAFSHWIVCYVKIVG